PRRLHPLELGRRIRASDLLDVGCRPDGRPDVEVPALRLRESKDPHNDHLIFSKGHASPLLYAIYKAAGAIPDDELLTFRKLGSRIEGHPTPVLPWVDVATGSLGQGLPIGVGVALAGRRLDQLPYRVWVLCGDSEMAEGSIWEAFEHAAFNGLDNLTAIIDVNRLGQTGETMHGWDLDAYAQRAEANGWHAIKINGHDVAAIDAAYAEAIGNTGRPTVILAKTEKGHGVAEVANKNGFHGKPLPHPEEAIAELGGIRNIHVDVPKPEGAGEPHRFPTEELQPPAYDFVRMAAVSRANLVLTGSHAGVSIGEDGPSQMALEDIAALRAVHGSTVLYPSDPNQTADLMRQLPDREGIVFLRTTREK